jgi:hypothetical protein
MKTLNDQYQQIKKGKGHKGMFLTEAKRQFPNYVRTAASFHEAETILKQRGVINEGIVSLEPINNPFSTSKKESYEVAFEAFLAEAKKKENEDEKVKAIEKKPSKKVKEDADKNFDNTDEKTPDNMIFDQIMMGYYAEMKDPKNSEKTMQELKDIVFKNLAKDSIYYTREGQFGIKDLGYSVDHPGLGEPKEAKGKYKASGYGDLKEALGKNYPGEIEGEYEGELQKIYGADIYDTLKDILDISNSENDFMNKVAYSLTDETNMLPKSSKDKLKIWYRNNISNMNESKLRKVIREINDDEIWDDIASELDLTSDEFDEALNNSMAELGIIEKIYFSNSYTNKEKLSIIADLLKLPHNSQEKSDMNESKLRKVIREIIDEEIEEVRGGGNYGILTINPSGGGGGRRFIPDQIALPSNIRKRFGDHMVYNPGNNTFYISQILYNNLIKGYADQPAIKKLIMDIPMMAKQLLNKTENYGPSVNLPKEFKTYMPFIAPVEKAKEDKFNKAGDKQYWAEGDLLIPNLNKEKYSSPEGDSEELAESLMESVEKDLAQINKEAEDEIIASKLEKVQALIDKKQSQISKLDEDEDMKALTDDKKVKEIQKDIKALEKAKAKLEKLMSKGKGKSKEVIDETEDEDFDIESYEDEDKNSYASSNMDDIESGNIY